MIFGRTSCITKPDSMFCPVGQLTFVVVTEVEGLFLSSQNIFGLSRGS
jgi:hypothetical protein